MACNPASHGYSAVLNRSFYASSAIVASFVIVIFMLRNITFRSIGID